MKVWSRRFRESRISKVMYKARCRRSREDARGPKKNREIHLRLHLSYFLYDFLPQRGTQRCPVTGQDLSHKMNDRIPSVHLLAVDPLRYADAKTAPSATLLSFLLGLDALSSQLKKKKKKKEIAGKIFENTKMDTTFDEWWQQIEIFSTTRVRYVRLVFPHTSES